MQARWYKEYITGVRELAGDFKQVKEIKELAVDIATDGHWRIYIQDVRFLHQASNNLQPVKNSSYNQYGRLQHRR